MSQPFSKGWMSYADQVKLLAQRGLVIGDTNKAERYLTHVNYYRFSGYCLAFEVSRHTFVAGTTFEQVEAAYQFDLELRDLLTEALEIVEVDLRAAIAYYFGKKYGAFGHTKPSNFFKHFSHQDWLDKLHEESRRSSELFVKHFKQSYNEFPDLPVWIVTEVMSFGALSRMLSGMIRDDQKAIANQYGLQPAVFQSWMHHLVVVRNLCAHHSRLWDRVWGVKPTLPYGKDWQMPYLRSNRHLLSTLFLLRYWLKRVPAVAGYATTWKHRIESHLQNLPSVSNVEGRMGITNDWTKSPVWK